MSAYSGFLLRRSSFRKLFFKNRFCSCDAGEQALTRVTSPARKATKEVFNESKAASVVFTTWKFSHLQGGPSPVINAVITYLNDLIILVGNWGFVILLIEVVIPFITDRNSRGPPCRYRMI